MNICQESNNKTTYATKAITIIRCFYNKWLSCGGFDAGDGVDWRVTWFQEESGVSGREVVT